MASKIESDILYFATQACLQKEEEFKEAEWQDALYWLNIHLTKLAEESAQFKRDLKARLEWFSRHEEETNNAIFLAFCLLNISCFFVPFASVSVAKGSLWNLCEGLAVSLALLQAETNSLPEKIVLGNNIIGTGALFACIPISILIATGVALSPVIPHLLVLIACYSDVISYGYNLYQAIQNNDPDVKQKALSFTSINLTAAGFTFLSAAPLFSACPPLALGFLIAGFVCLGLSGLIRTAQFMANKSAAKNTPPAAEPPKPATIQPTLSDKSCTFLKKPVPIFTPSSMPEALAPPALAA